MRLYRKAIDSGNRNLIGKEMGYPEDPEELREFLKDNIDGRSWTELIEDGDGRFYDKARNSGNLDLVPNKKIEKEIKYPVDPDELRNFSVEKSVAGSWKYGQARS